MNAQLTETQPTLNIWETPSRVMLHERRQGGFARLPAVQKSIFDDLERQMSAQQEEFNASMTLLRRYFIFKSGESVASFLRTHRALIPILLEATTHLFATFGADVPLALEIISDDGPPNSISALALFDGNITEARAALNSFDQSWWMANMRRTNGRIVFDYDLV